MRHPTEGVLRRLLDEPAAMADADREHVVDCRACLGDLAEMRDDADLVHAALATTADADDVDLDAAWQRLSSAAAAPAAAAQGARAAAAAPRTARIRELRRRPVVAGVAVALVLTGAGTAAANDWLQIFRTERVAPVAFDAADLNALPDLREYGDVVVSGEPDVHEVADAAGAASETGLDVPEVTDLPRGVSGEPTYQVGGEVSATFTYSADRTARAAEPGTTSPPPPPGLDGSQVRLEAGPGVAAVWTASGGIPSLVVGRAVAPTAFSSGVPFETMRDHLLSLPGLPDEVAAQLRMFDADSATMPLPVPAAGLETSSADVDGSPATVLASRDRTMAAVVWVDDGVLTAVAGALDTDEVLSIARELR